MISKKAQVSVRNYLRVRGEYPTTRFRRRGRKELPPRTRRILSFATTAASGGGTTSAYAENTGPRSGPKPLTGNYLRVRGEYMPRQSRFGRAAELPPRTRRIPLTSPPKMNSQGTTSAYAENTPHPSSLKALFRNYLRVRGEYMQGVFLLCEMGELPPRTRRIQHHENVCGVNLGTTSAYAENTNHQHPPHDPRRNYLRVRGEYEKVGFRLDAWGELPPRTRRIHAERVINHGRAGTTSAYAENTLCGRRVGRYRGNYLRVRGEYLRVVQPGVQEFELPPRTRRIPDEAV